VWIRERFNAALAAQLGRPTGFGGRLVGRMLNRGNRAVVLGSVQAADVNDGQTAVDVGFGGGIGLALLLDRVGEGGQVHGVEISGTMLAGARRRFQADLEASRLHLHDAAMDRLPLADASVDGLISTNTIYFIEDLDSAFAELARVLRPSARAVLGVGDPAAMTEMPVTKHGFRLRPIAEVTERLAGAGLRVAEDRRVGDGIRKFHLLVCIRP
jgi:arsenite methyltransferase